jgi:gamma-glutamylcyclotransferase (GGCT)/AIG2-like uncharacterized protein YtfP
MSQLFVYGRLLWPHKRFNISAPGELRIREPGGDAAAKFGPEYGGLVWGQVHQVPDFADYDHLEAPEYRRRVVELSNGEYAYAYECCTAEWPDYPLVPSGRYEDASEAPLQGPWPEKT